MTAQSEEARRDVEADSRRHKFMDSGWVPAVLRRPTGRTHRLLFLEDDEIEAGWRASGPSAEQVHPGGSGRGRWHDGPPSPPVAMSQEVMLPLAI